MFQLRLGWDGYRSKVHNQIQNAKYIRDRIKKMQSPEGKPWFEIIDCGDIHCLPVLGARLNPDLDLKFDDIDIQHGLTERYVESVM
jgi:glutamate/tyrosine decarboxylase-like PLP-dependent enzyme